MREQERWQRIKELFDAALDRDGEARARFLSAATPDDPSLGSEVLGLLASDQQAGAFLSAPPSLGESFVEPLPNLQGRHIGPYRVLAEIGHGGMGIVYRAVRDDDQYQKQVAIKLVRGGMDAESVLQRFRAERQILANLEHPNIARLLDGGTTEEGWPYFSMEYVEGQPIDRYCAALGVRERLELFRTVCAAVQHAHQRLVIHRDLKPSNILVSADGVPKLLDFGVAKLLGADVVGPSEATLTVWPLMTPEYASPEQVKGEVVTTASDVYSLGMLLYELLARRRAYEIKTRAPEELARVVCQQEAEKPSTLADWPLSRQLKGDLDTIVLKAIRKEPARRYQTVGELSEDLHRYLAGLPVLARGDTLAYRAGKFVRRHKAAVVAAGLLALSLLGGIAATVREARIAEANRARAERRFNDVRKLASAVVGELHDAIKDLPGATPARKLLVTRAGEYLDSLALEVSGDESLQRELAGAYAKIGDAQGNPYVANLGDPAAALRSYRKAFEIYAALSAAHPAEETLRRDLAAGHDRIADMLWAKGEYPEALDRYRMAMGIFEALASVDGTRLEDRFNMSGVLRKVGQVQIRAGDLPAALQTYRQSLALVSGLLAAAPRSVAYRRGFAVSALKIGDVTQLMHDYHTALASHREAERVIGELSRENPASADLRRLHGAVLSRVASGNLHLHRPVEAVALGRKALDIQQALAATDPENLQIQFDMADTYGTLGEALSAEGEESAAANEVRRGISMRERAHSRNPGYAAEGQNFARLYLTLGAVLSKTDAAGAFEAYRKAASLLEVEPVRSQDPSLLAESYAGLGDAQAKLAGAAPEAARAPQWQAARRWYEKSLAIWGTLRDHGKLAPDQVDRPKQIEQRIARCYPALAKPGRAGPR